jgi:hypothetical protein
MERADIDWSLTSPKMLRERIFDCLPSMPADELKNYSPTSASSATRFSECKSGQSGQSGHTRRAPRSG